MFLPDLVARGDIGRRVIGSGGGGACCAEAGGDDGWTGGGDCDGGGGRVECAEGVGGGDRNRVSGGGDWNTCVGEGGDGVAVRSTVGAVVRFLLLCPCTCLCDFFDAKPCLDVDACGGVASILAFFRGGAGPESSLVS